MKVGERDGTNGQREDEFRWIYGKDEDDEESRKW
jgi:hypothetical protein